MALISGFPNFWGINNPNNNLGDDEEPNNNINQPPSQTMAEAMYGAFLDAWPNYMEVQPKPEGPNPQLQLMFVAIAKGIVKHLTEHPEAFAITVNTQNGHRHDLPGSIGGKTDTDGDHNHTANLEVVGN
ncbi:MAG: hypothetical protein MI974_04990 [Chitinophagales bacterium]|nr:hypothetical protein [Chitinophagales bacterium]